MRVSCTTADVRYVAAGFTATEPVLNDGMGRRSEKRLVVGWIDGSDLETGSNLEAQVLLRTYKTLVVADLSMTQTPKCA